jgi:predicted RNase H-like nuclease (RuvC/YqgF family)
LIGLNKLTSVFISNNLCTNKDFQGSESIATLRENFPSACVFVEFVDQKSCSDDVDAWKKEASAWRDENTKTQSQYDLIKDTFETMTAVREAFEKLDAARSKNCSLKNEQHEIQMDFKLSEISRLENELAEIKAENNENKRKVKNLEAKVKLCNQ